MANCDSSSRLRSHASRGDLRKSNNFACQAKAGEKLIASSISHDGNITSSHLPERIDRIIILALSGIDSGDKDDNLLGEEGIWEGMAESWVHCLISQKSKALVI
jgi:hypothetical protein